MTRVSQYRQALAPLRGMYGISSQLAFQGPQARFGMQRDVTAEQKRLQREAEAFEKHQRKVGNYAGIGRMLGIAAALTGVGIPLSAVISAGGQFAGQAAAGRKPGFGGGKFLKDTRGRARKQSREWSRELPWQFGMNTVKDMVFQAMYPEIAQGVQGWMKGLGQGGPMQGTIGGTQQMMRMGVQGGMPYRGLQGPISGYGGIRGFGPPVRSIPRMPFNTLTAWGG